MSDRENAFGPERDDPAGITPMPHMVMPSQLTDFSVESCAMHSQSLGWIPAVTLRILNEDGSGIVTSITVGPELEKIVTDIKATSNRARRDLAVAIQKGTLPHG